MCIIKNQLLDKIPTVNYNGKILLPISENIKNLFGTKKIEFQISIKDNRLIFESPEILVDLDNQDNQLVAEIINDK